MPPELRDLLNDARGAHRSGARARLLCWIAVAAGAAVLGIGVGFIAMGHAVPLWLYAAALAAALLAFGIWTAVYRRSDAFVAGQLDHTFGLADGVRTASGRTVRDAFDAAQLHQTLAATRGLDLGRLRVMPGRKLITAAVLLPLLAGALGFRGPSAAVLDAQREAAATLALGEALNAGIRAEIDDVLEQADDDTRSLLEPDALEALAEELTLSEDRAELMRQYAAMEQELARREAALDQPAAEQMMADAARAMASDTATSDLARALREKRFEDAAQMLAEMRPDAADTPEDAKRKRDRLERAANQLAAAGSRLREASGGAGSGGLADGMARAADDLARATRSLSRLEKQASRSRLSDAERRDLERSRTKCAGACDALTQSLRKLAACRKAGACLARLRNTLSQCQGACAGSCASPFGSNRNGSRAGTGSADGLNRQIDPATGQLETLTGTPGAGPSDTVVEEADFGTGVSRRRVDAATAEARRRELESFVGRADIPDSLKEGVKTYFEDVHDGTGETPPAE